MSEGFLMAKSGGSPILKKSYNWYVGTNGRQDLTNTLVQFVKVHVLPTSYTSFYMADGTKTVYYPDTILSLGEEVAVTVYFAAGNVTWDHRIKLVDSKTLRSYQNYGPGNGNNNQFYLEIFLE